MLVLNLRAFENKKYAPYDHFHRNGLYGKILTKKEPIRTLGFAVPYNNEDYCLKFSKFNQFNLHNNALKTQTGIPFYNYCNCSLV